MYTEIVTKLVTENPNTYAKTLSGRANAHILEWINTKPDADMKEKIYFILTGKEATYCHCGTRNKLISLTKGYRVYCSAKCANAAQSMGNEVKDFLSKYNIELLSAYENNKAPIKVHNNTCGYEFETRYDNMSMLLKKNGKFCPVCNTEVKRENCRTQFTEMNKARPE